MGDASRAPKGLPWFASLMVGKGQQWGFLAWLFLRCTDDLPVTNWDARPWSQCQKVA
jgi:hypothetical protein